MSKLNDFKLLKDSEYSDNNFIQKLYSKVSFKKKKRTTTKLR